MIHYVTRVAENELFRNRQTGLTFWKVQGGWPIKMEHLQQSITECNIVVILITPSDDLDRLYYNLSPQ